jgi:hypothetical protein
VAVACVLGVPVERLVYGDAVERLYWEAVAGRAVALDELRRDNQAAANANQIGELLRRMFRRRGRRA